jgi:hypothetical protein
VVQVVVRWKVVWMRGSVRLDVLGGTRRGGKGYYQGGGYAGGAFASLGLPLLLSFPVHSVEVVEALMIKAKSR